VAATEVEHGHPSFWNLWLDCVWPGSRLPGCPLSTAKAEESQAWLDRLVEASVTLGTRLQARKLRAVLRAVEASDSPDDLRRRLVELLGDMAPDALAQLLADARTVGQASGAFAVMDEVKK
jgi:hypothetical protein